ncbi:MAG: LysM peptidoglycan-binding domain-containing M23 family metallopeptidase [Oscillatoriales cyanobacterium SM2_1_8]|nr:LysM peptidoglycan-binding domain-containing M23 family metallopeptidase [Oscillatoriales cyanobacterium SM2_1_8]
MSSLQRHEVKTGETLFSIAQRYRRQPATLMALNPAVRSGRVQPGQTLAIPRADGLVHRLADGDNYRSVAQRYGVRPDVLFEQNGCQPQPVALFVPGAIWQQEVKVPDLVTAARPRYEAAAWQLPTMVFPGDGYPLPFPVPVTSSFGWRQHPVTGETSFHSGIEFGGGPGHPGFGHRRRFGGFCWGGRRLRQFGHPGPRRSPNPIRPFAHDRRPGGATGAARPSVGHRRRHRPGYGPPPALRSFDSGGRRLARHRSRPLVVPVGPISLKYA